jgi:tRNA modification GTPase
MFEDVGTIAAVATAAGKGAIALIRVSGPGATTIGHRLVHPMPSTPREVQLSEIRSTDGVLLDRGIVCLFKAPQSYTGEDVLEISVHGGLVVPDAVLSALLEAGARLALPGEFTRRALLNGKLDLLQAEAVADLIDARSTAAHRQGLQQLDGGLSRQIEHLRQQLLSLESLLAYDIDFPEEDDGPIPRDRIRASAQGLHDALEDMLATSTRGRLIHDGALVVLAGAPNVGKSSLFNAMLGQARAIVTDIPGTTRDAIEAMLDTPDVPLRLVDTAGLRDAGDPIELLGIETTRRYLREADIVLACVTPETMSQTTTTLAHHRDTPTITVGMKGDLVPIGDEYSPDVIVSAVTRAGLSELLERIGRVVASTKGVERSDRPSLTRARHRALVSGARDEVAAFIRAWDDDGLPAPVAATHIHAAISGLEEMIGAIHVEDILDVVFSSFCVGK